MIVTKIETPFKQFLESLKVPSSPSGKGGTLFNPDEINYLTRNSRASVHEFKQEYETDREFYEMFVKWLHEEDPIHDYYIEMLFIYKFQVLSKYFTTFYDNNYRKRSDDRSAPSARLGQKPRRFSKPDHPEPGIVRSAEKVC